MKTMRQRIVGALLLAALPLLPQTATAQTADLGTIDFPTSGAAEAQKLFIHGVLLLHSFEYADAAEAFREAQRLNPDFAMAYVCKGMVHYLQGEGEASDAAFREAIERSGRADWIYQTLIDWYLSQGNARKAAQMGRERRRGEG